MSTLAAELDARPAPAAIRPACGRLEWVGFKWLMCTQGEPVDVVRATNDALYARRCLERGLQASDEDLREISRRMLARLDAR